MHLATSCFHFHSYAVLKDINRSPLYPKKKLHIYTFIECISMIHNLFKFNHLKFHRFMPYYHLIYQSSEGKGHFSYVYNENIRCIFVKVDVV